MNMERETGSTPLTNETPLDDRPDEVLGRMATGAWISLAGVGVGKGLDFAKQVAMARLLGAELFGLYAIGWNFLRIIGFLLPLGLQHGVVYFATPHLRERAGALKSVLVRTVGISFAVGWLGTAVMWLAAPWIVTTLFKEPEFLGYFRLFTLMLPFMASLHVAAQASRISQRMQFAIASEEIAQAVASLGLFLVFYWIGWQLFGAILSTVLSFVVAFGLALYFLFRLFGPALRAASLPLDTNREMIAYSLPTALSGVFGIIISRIDRIFLGIYWPAADVGVYQAAAQLSVIMALVLNAFNMILTPLISEQYHRGNYAQMEELFRINTKWGIYCIVPLVLVIMFRAEAIMLVLFGLEYVGGTTALRILTIGQFINIATGASGIMLIMTGHQQHWLRLSIAIAVVNVGLNLWLIPQFGMNGAAVATALTVGGLFSIGLLVVRRTLGLWPYDRRYLKGLAAASVATIAIVFTSTFVTTPAVDLIVTAVVATVAFFGTLLILGLDAEDKAFISSIRSKIKPA